MQKTTERSKLRVVEVGNQIMRLYETNNCNDNNTNNNNRGRGRGKCVDDEVVCPTFEIRRSMGVLTDLPMLLWNC